MGPIIQAWWPVLVPFLVIIVGGTVGGIWAIVNRRGGDKNKSRIPMPPTWPEMWARIDALEKRVDTLEDEKETLQHTTGAMLAHIRVLEAQIPVPPGAPKRPDWTQELSLAL